MKVVMAVVVVVLQLCGGAVTRYSSGDGDGSLLLCLR